MDPYAVLGVPPGASEEELARAYRRLAKRHHPDAVGVSGMAQMMEINAAYELARVDRRLLWLLDDVVTGRVRSLRFDAIESIETRARWRRMVLDIRARNGRRQSFAGLRPETAAQITRHVEAACAPS